MDKAGNHLMDSPVSNSLPDEEGWTFRIMASVSGAIPEQSTPMMSPVSATLKANTLVAKTETKEEITFRVSSPEQRMASAPMPQWNDS